MHLKNYKSNTNLISNIIITLYMVNCNPVVGVVSLGPLSKQKRLANKLQFLGFYLAISILYNTDPLKAIFFSSTC